MKTPANSEKFFCFIREFQNCFIANFKIIFCHVLKLKKY